MERTGGVVGVKLVAGLHLASAEDENVVTEGVGIVVAESIFSEETRGISGASFAAINDQGLAFAVDDDLAGIVVLMVVFAAGLAADDGRGVLKIPRGAAGNGRTVFMISTTERETTGG